MAMTGTNANGTNSERGLPSARDDPDRIVDRYFGLPRKPKERPPLPGVRDRFDLYLPQSYVHTRLWEAIRRQDPQAEATTREGVPAYRPVDRPYGGRIVVLPRDEREARYGKALLVADLPTADQPDRAPLLVVGAGEMAWQEALELVDEARHYGLDRPVLPERLPAASAYRIWLDMADRRRRGMRTTGPGTFPTLSQRYPRSVPGGGGAESHQGASGI
jgi:hypothetical protein